MRTFPASDVDDDLSSDVKKAIRAAAMRCFAEHGTEAASLRMVALDAGVSVGLIQHYYGSKAALVEAVDAELVAILKDAAPPPIPAPNTVADIGQRTTALIAKHPEALDYLAHLLIRRAPTGQAIFDALVDIGRAQWTHLSQQGLVVRTYVSRCRKD